MSRVTWYPKDALVAAAKARIEPQVPVVLDVGPGIRPQALVMAQCWLLVEPYLPYIEWLRQRLPPVSPQFVFLNGTWDQVLPLLPDQSVDTLIAGDVIEHLPKAEGWRLLKEAERIVRGQIVVLTPLGFHPQGSEDPSIPDRWGMSGGPWQMHRSGWTPEDFDDVWECLCCEQYHFEDEHNQPLEKGFGAFYAIWSRA